MFISIDNASPGINCLASFLFLTTLLLSPIHLRIVPALIQILYGAPSFKSESENEPPVTGTVFKNLNLGVTSNIIRLTCVESFGDSPSLSTIVPDIRIDESVANVKFTLSPIRFCPFICSGNPSASTETT